MIEDAELLRRFSKDRSESAFAELVGRHINFVYSAALRQANGDTHLAKDATQLVFADLARKAPALAGRSNVAGWLFTSTRFAVANLIRGERRRQRREQEAQSMMQENQADAAASLDWARTRPVLDDALAALNEADREAVLFRFFEGRDFPTIAARFQLSENAARMRVDRALDRLHAQLAGRGVKSSAAALAVALAQQGVIAAPAGLAVSVTGGAIAAASSTGILTAAGIFMSTNKLAVGVAGVVLSLGAAGFMVQSRTESRLQAEIGHLRAENDQVAALRAENVRLARQVAEVDSLRTDGTALGALGAEADALKSRMEHAAQTVASRVAAAAALDSRNVDRPPLALHQVRPNYSPELKAAGIAGEVIVDFVVDAKGKVRNARVASSTHEELDAAAVAAVSQWEFSPGQKGGRMVNTRLQVPIVFKPDNGNAAYGQPTVPGENGGK